MNRVLEAPRRLPLPGVAALLRGTVVLGCAALLAHSLRGVDLPRVLALLAGAGPWVVLGLLPFALAQTVDAEAWRRVLGRLGARVPLLELYPVRVAVEALTTSLPAGVVVAESVAPRLLARGFGVPPSSTLAAAGARRVLTMRAHAVYVGLGGVACFFVLRARGGDASPVLRAAPFVVLASALLPLASSFAVSLTLAGGSRVARLHALLARLPLPPLRAWLAQKREAFVATDAGLAALLGDRRALRAPLGLLVLAWLLESVEAFVLLRLAGAHLGFVEVLAFEAGLSVLKSAWFFAPAGLGATDLGYLGALRLLGVPEADAVGAAFLVLKRAREVLWIALGYGWLSLRGGRTEETRAVPGGPPGAERHAALG